MSTNYISHRLDQLGSEKEIISSIMVATYGEEWGEVAAIESLSGMELTSLFTLSEKGLTENISVRS